MALTASNKEAIRAWFYTIFKNGATINPELIPVPVTQEALLTSQTANVSKIMDAQDQCVALRVLHRVANNTALPTSSTSPINSICALADGDGLSTVATDYALNYFIKKSITVSENDCGNYATWQENLAFLTIHALSLMVQQMNIDKISDLEANKSVATALPNIDDLTINGGGDYVLTGAEYWKGLEANYTSVIFDQIARAKGLPANYIIIKGYALQVPMEIAKFAEANTNERSFIQAWNGKRVFTDQDNLDDTIGEQCVFLVDPNALLAYFHSEYPDAPKTLNDADSTTIYSMALEYYDSFRNASMNISPVQYRNGGALTTARIDVRHQYKCVTGGPKGKVTGKNTYEFDLCALSAFVPKASTDNTGIVKIVKAV